MSVRQQVHSSVPICPWSKLCVMLRREAGKKHNKCSAISGAAAW